MTDSQDRGWFKKALVTAALGVVATVVGAIALNLLDLGGSPGPTPTPAPTPTRTGGAEPVAPSAEPVVHEVIKTARLELKDGIGWDLDIEPGAPAYIQSNWNPGTDLGYTSWDKTIDEDAILTPDNKIHAASLPAGARGTREECAAAKYGNYAVGKAILPGRLVCIETTGERYALLRVLSKDTRDNHWSVTVEATIWS
jgi:hypothetical protein